MNSVDLKVLKKKEILTVKEAATLLNRSVRSVYRHISKGQIKAINLGHRLTRIKRTDISITETSNKVKRAIEDIKTIID